MGNYRQQGQYGRVQWRTVAVYYRILCTRCEYPEWVVDRLSFALLEDGREAFLAHPAEGFDAIAYTGQDWSALRKAGRLRSRVGYLCLFCGAVGYYGQYEGRFEGFTESQFEHALQTGRAGPNETGRREP